eukprot:2288265-Rhodomonas_salina.1
MATSHRDMPVSAQCCSRRLVSGFKLIAFWTRPGPVTPGQPTGKGVTSWLKTHLGATNEEREEDGAGREADTAGGGGAAALAVPWSSPTYTHSILGGRVFTMLLSFESRTLSLFSAEVRGCCVSQQRRVAPRENEAHLSTRRWPTFR